MFIKLKNKKVKKILITGSTGYLGDRLRKCFINYGFDIVALNRKETSINVVKSEKVKIFYIEDLFLRSTEVLDDVDLVVHLATCYGRNGESESEVMEANLHIPSKLLDLCIRNNIQKFINCDTSLPMEVNNYAKSKKLFLNYAISKTKIKKIKIINMRLESFYGPNEPETKLPAFIIKSCLRGDEKISLSPGEQIRDFVHIDDVVSAFVKVIKNIDILESDTYYIEFQVGTGDGCSIKKFAETIKNIMKSNTRLNFGEIEYRENEVMCSIANNQSLRDIGWVPKYHVESGLMQVIEEQKDYSK